MKRGRNVYLIGAIMFLLLLTVALGFVLLLRPANSEYNNTIPAFMGILTLIGTGVSALITQLNLNQKHHENQATLKHIEEKAGETDGG